MRGNGGEGGIDNITYCISTKTEKEISRTKSAN